MNDENEQETETEAVEGENPEPLRPDREQGELTADQVWQLLAPIAPTRVLTANGQSHVSQQDVTAHLMRVFGFGGFDTELLGLEQVFETERTNPATGELIGRWDVCYRATLRLTVKDQYGRVVAHHEDGSTGLAENQPKRGDAHDLAMKSAISLAKKRCAINWGDQFGLSLYNKGQQAALVSPKVDGVVHVPLGNRHLFPEVAAADHDMQANVPAQVSLGNDETAYEGGASYTVADLVARVEAASTEDELRTVWLDAGAAHLLESRVVEGADETLAQFITASREALVNPPVAPPVDPSTTEAQQTDGTAADIARAQQEES